MSSASSSASIAGGDFILYGNPAGDPATLAAGRGQLPEWAPFVILAAIGAVVFIAIRKK